MFDRRSRCELDDRGCKGNHFRTPDESIFGSVSVNKKTGYYDTASNELLRKYSNFNNDQY